MNDVQQNVRVQIMNDMLNVLPSAARGLLFNAFIIYMHVYIYIYIYI